MRSGRHPEYRESGEHPIQSLHLGPCPCNLIIPGTTLWERMGYQYVNSSLGQLDFKGEGPGDLAQCTRLYKA